MRRFLAVLSLGVVLGVLLSSFVFDGDDGRTDTYARPSPTIYRTVTAAPVPASTVMATATVTETAAAPTQAPLDGLLCPGDAATASSVICVDQQTFLLVQLYGNPDAHGGAGAGVGVGGGGGSSACGGGGPYYVGDPGYSSERDANGDGVACE